MRKARFDFSEVALSQVETVYETIKSFVSSNNYESLKIFLNRTLLSAKQYYYLLDVLLYDDKLFNDIKFAKILFSSELQYLNDKYRDGFDEPLAQTLLYYVDNLTSDVVYELFIDKESKIRFDEENINLDNVLQVLIDVSNRFSNEQFTELTKFFISKQKININHINDYGKTALDLFLYRQRNNNDVFEILIKNYQVNEKKKIETNINTYIENYLKYSNEEYKSLPGNCESIQKRINLRKKEFNRLFN